MQCTWELAAPRVEEAEALGALHVAIWRHAYAGLMPQAHLDALDPAASAARWRETAARVDGGGWHDGVRALVAREGGRPVGMAVGGRPREEGAPTACELWSLNVDPAFHGRGVARALTDALLPEGAAHLWVLRGNGRAIAFYRKLGFELDGVEKWDDRHECVDLRMLR